MERGEREGEEKKGGWEEIKGGRGARKGRGEEERRGEVESREGEGVRREQERKGGVVGGRKVIVIKGVGVGVVG